MADEDKKNQSETNSLEGGSDSGTTANPDALKDDKKKDKAEVGKVKQGFAGRIAGMVHGVNIYLIAFVVLFIIAIVVVFVALSSESSGPTLTGQDLNQEALDELLQNEANVGDVSQTLTVEANAIFNGKILVRDNLDVAGSINVGGPLTLPGITVAGTSAFDNVEVGNNLAIQGNTTIQGSLSVNQGISINGDGAFGGDLSARSISVEDLQFSGDFSFSGHLDTGGPIPGVSQGGSIGAGGTVSLSGNDTSGTVTINTGTSPSAGTLVQVTFQSQYNDTPQVLISPVGSTAAGLNYYVTRTTTGFTIRTTNSPNSSTTYVFDYWVVE